MAKQGRCPQELSERAVRMVQEHRSEYTSGWQATQSIAGKFGMHPVTLHSGASGQRLVLDSEPA